MPASVLILRSAKRVSKDEATAATSASWFETPCSARKRYAGLLTMRIKFLAPD